MIAQGRRIRVGKPRIASSTSTEPFAPVAACPGGQGRQSVSLPSPSRLAYRPAGQGRQAVKLAFENRPASQTEHAVVGSPSSSVTANFPESQDLQSDALPSRISSLYLPAGHAEQLSDPFDAKVPMLQMSQNVAPWLAEKKPASQEGQEASPGMNWKLPGGQGIGNPGSLGHFALIIAIFWNPDHAVKSQRPGGRIAHEYRHRAIDRGSYVHLLTVRTDDDASSATRALRKLDREEKATPNHLRRPPRTLAYRQD
eukprot:scaffold22_cov329-Pinguiococcus_pyrenoidosus.AAC.1